MVKEQRRKVSLLFKSKNKSLVESDQRITNDTIEDFRQGVIEKGRRFKYPIQYERHKVVINASIVALLALIALVSLTWWGLYRSNADNLILFKLTQVLPIPIGKIDEENVSYGDYLAQYRSSLHYYQTKEGLPSDEDSLGELKNQFRNQAYVNAAKVAFAKKLAAKEGVSLTEEERSADIDSKLNYGGSQLSREAYDEIMMQNYGLNRSEYERLFVNNPLLVRKLMFAIDDSARSLAEELASKLAADGSNFEALAEEYGNGRVIVSDSGLVKHANSDGGRSKVALSLDVNGVAGPIASTDSNGYYFVRLISKNDSTLRYQSILVPLVEFSKRFDAIKNSDQNRVYANIEVKFD